MKRMTTHRHIQIHNLEDTCSAKVVQFRRGASNLARIGNDKGAGHQLRRALKYERIAAKCRARLGVSARAERPKAENPTNSDPPR